MNHQTSRIRQQSKYRQGAAAVEFAIAITVLLMIVFASIEFSRLSMLRHSAEYASYVGSRKAMIIGASSNDVQDAVNEHLLDLGVTGVTVSVNPSNIKDDTEIVEVTVDVPVSGNSWISPVYYTGNIQGRTRLLTERAAADMLAKIPSGP